MWTPSVKYLAQNTHLLFSCALVFFTALQGWEPWWAVLLIVIGAAIKEFWADIFWLEKDTFDGSATDFTFYLAGAILARLVCCCPLAGILVLCVVFGLWTVYDIFDGSD
jgi:hypothetical protein